MPLSRRLLRIVMVVIAAILIALLLPSGPEQAASDLRAAIDSRSSDVQVQDSGVIVKVLPDDLHGSRHQRLLLRIDGGGTLMIAHNIDLAPRVPNPQTGETLEFYGEYEWSEKGGVVHWTHHDPAGRHPGGWLKYEGSTYD